jgi:hypothetical protein
MPFYTYESEDNEKIEKFFSMNEFPEEIKKNGKLYKRVPEFGTTFHLKGMGWVSKGTGTASSPKKGKEVGIKIDYDKKQEMKRTGEI